MLQIPDSNFHMDMNTYRQVMELGQLEIIKEDIKTSREGVSNLLCKSVSDNVKLQGRLSAILNKFEDLNKP